MKVITTQKELATFCHAVQCGDFITVDTEFVREKTYFPKLCLLQIAGEAAAAIIDPLAKDIDLAPVFSLMANEKLLKVFHAAKQDIEIFLLLSGKIPTPIFDTQIAAAVCGYGESASYEMLVNKIADAPLDKSSRFSDWAARPLTEKQLAYALSDVTYLREIYVRLKTQIEDTNRTSWITEEHARLSDPAAYRVEPRDAWRRLKYGHMRPKHLAILRELAAWREEQARERDVPRGRILKDEMLVELALSAPRTPEDLARIRTIYMLAKRDYAAVLTCIEKALALPASDYPHVDRHRRPSENITGAMAMLQLLLKVQADKHDIAAPMIANKDDLESIALGQENSRALSGWRFDIFGKQATALMQGKLTLSVNHKNKQVVLEEG